jgi:hypothetical protein
LKKRAQSRIGGDSMLFVGDVGYSRHSDAQIHRNPVDAQREWSHKFSSQNLARMYWLDFRRHPAAS